MATLRESSMQQKNAFIEIYIALGKEGKIKTHSAALRAGAGSYLSYLPVVCDTPGASIMETILGRSLKQTP